MISAGARRTVVSLRVRFGETDAMGVANNGAYLAWFEVGRVEYLRELGHSYADVHAGGMDMVVVEAHAEYLKAARETLSRPEQRYLREKAAQMARA